MNTLTFKHFNQFPEISHGILTRNGGVSNHKYQSLNLSYKVGDNKSNVDKNRQIVSRYFNLPDNKLLFPDQCHTANVQVITNDNTEEINLENTDAIISTVKETGIGVLAADCYPILFYDPENKIIAAAHAGWSGTVKGITSKVIRILKTQYYSSPENIFIGIGPGISINNYEVDNSVISEVNNLKIKRENCYFSSERIDRFYLDLAQINYQLILAEEIPEKNIELLNICTYNNPKLFFSARRDGFETGRFGAVIKLNR